MILKLKRDVNQKELYQLIDWLSAMGVDAHFMTYEGTNTLGLIGDTGKLDIELLRGMRIVESVTRIKEPFKSANRKFHKEDTVIDVSGVKIGGGSFVTIAGPCSVESTEQITSIAWSVKMGGASILRGGAFKPRSSPYSFQGLREKGIELLVEAKKISDLPIITEIMDISSIELFENVDIIQVGARNMQNFELLRELGHIKKPILLKRGLASTLQEFLMCAEYIMAGGNTDVILCERGIRTFENSTRNTLDISAIPLLKEMSHLPVFVDPSHASGIARLVRPLALASVAAGADGVMMEVHNDPEHALCDGMQSITPNDFMLLMKDIINVREVLFHG